ncbi:MAG TPA: ECF transporter S component [Symbiobacteriaceae bacterium]|jgi:riboflavin transporter FmnP|nr:ECF transporter S component [Symbiobacteriaceae bacterium]
MNTRTLTRLGMLSAVAFALMFVGEIPVPMIPGAKFDLSEIPTVLAALGMGPLAGLVVEVLKDLLFLASGKSQAGLVGVAANLVAGGTLTLAAGFVAHMLGLRWGATDLKPGQYWLRGAVAVLVGAAAMAGVMFVVNAYVFIPLWIKTPGVQWAMSAAWLPFNLIKGALAGTFALALHRRAAPYLLSVAGRVA